jgi:hemolysin D
MAEKLNYKAGEYVFREGETANYAYVLNDGQVDIIKTTEDGYLTLAKISKGTIFGEMALIDGQVRSAGALVAKDAVVTEVDSQNFQHYIRSNPVTAVNIMKRLSGLLRDANKREASSGLPSTDGEEELTREFQGQLSELETNIEKGILDTDQIYNAGPKKSIILAGFTVVLGFLLTAIFLNTFSIDTTVRTTGKFLNTIPNIEVQAANNSVIKALYVSRGSTVKKGDTVVILDGTLEESNLKANKEKIEAIKRKLLRVNLEQKAIQSGDLKFKPIKGLDTLNSEILVKRIEQFRSKLTSLNTNIDKLNRKISFSEDSVALIKRQFNLKKKIEGVQKSLYDQNISSYFKYLSSTDAALSAEKNFSESLSKLDELKSDLKGSKAKKKEFSSKWISDLGEKQGKENDALVQLHEERVRLVRAADDIVIKAPADGVVLDLPKLGFGSIVKEGDKIITLVRANVPLALEVDIDPKDINDVRINATVSIKLDALPFQEYGDMKGRLSYVSDDTYDESLSGVTGSFFRARVEILQKEIKNLPDDFKLTSGMTATADLIIGKRKLITYITRPITKGFDNAFSEPD